MTNKFYIIIRFLIFFGLFCYGLYFLSGWTAIIYFLILLFFGNFKKNCKKIYYILILVKHKVASFSKSKLLFAINDVRASWTCLVKDILSFLKFMNKIFMNSSLFCQHSTVIVQPFRKQQIVGSNPTVGSILNIRM